MTNTVNNAIPFVPENTIDPAAGLNEALKIVDMLLQLSVASVGDTAPPGSPAEGDRYIVGASATGAWASHDGELAEYLDAAWTFSTAYIALSQADGLLYVNRSGTWGTILGATDTGWTAGTGTANKGAFATGTATATDCAERILAIEQALLALGLISA